MSENLEQEVFLAQISEAIAEAAVTKFAMMHPELNKVKAEIPPPLKWAAGIISGMFVALSGAMVIWLITTVSDMQVTLARMDERQTVQADSQNDWKNGVETRLTRLEAVAFPKMGTSK